MTYQQRVVAVFNSRADADAAARDLRASGFNDNDINIHAADAEQKPTPTATDVRREEPGFLDWLFGAETTEAPLHRQAYQSAYEGGRTILTVTSIDDEAEYDRISDIIERHNPINLNEGEWGERFGGYQRESDRAGLGTDTGTGIGTAGTAGIGRDNVEGTGFAQTATGSEQALRDSTGEGTTEQVIPTAKEEMRVSKRQVRNARAYRVRTTVEEVPVEQQVHLRDKRVTVERRPATQGVSDDGKAFEERTVEVEETREEPVVEKVLRPKEDVVIKRDTSDRTETVRDTVRETHVEIERGDKKTPEPI